MITAYLIGDAETLARIDSFPSKAHDKIRMKVESLAIQLQSKVKGEKLSDQLLHVRTGRLRNSITYKITETSNGIYGTVGTKVEYARAHEYGFHGHVTVKQHLRNITMAWGKELKTPHAIQVKSHSRQANVKEKSFLRGSLSEMTPQIKEGLQKVLIDAAKAIHK